jgi:hypothetical protein
MSVSEDGFEVVDDSSVHIKRTVKVSAPIKLTLHLVAKHMYKLQGTTLAERIEELIETDLRRIMKTKWFQSLPDDEIKICKALLERDLRQIIEGDSSKIEVGREEE